MSSEIIKFDTKKIVNVDGTTARIIGLISVLEAYMSKVSKKAFNSIKSSNIDEITLRELGIVYVNWLIKNKGIHGVCWEYYIYHAIKHDDDYIQELINEAINLLIGSNTFEPIDTLLWGGEKDKIYLQNIKSFIDEDDMIWTVDGILNFKMYIDIIHDSFRKSESRFGLPKYATEIWRTDLFVKKRNSNTWFAVSVKWNRSEIKYYEGLSIGIVFNSNIKQGNSVNPELYSNNGVPYFTIINIYHWLAQYFIDVMNFVNVVLVNINVESNKSNVLKFPTVDEIRLFNLFKENRDSSCKQLITYLEEYYQINNRKYITDEVIAKTGRKIYVQEKEYQFINDIKILPKYVK